MSSQSFAPTSFAQHILLLMLQSQSRANVLKTTQTVKQIQTISGNFVVQTTQQDCKKDETKDTIRKITN